MRLLLAITCLALLAACRPAAPVATATPTTPELIGEVVILSPPAGALIYAEVMRISGTATNVPGDQFELALVGPDETNIADSVIQLDGESWQIELPHHYTAEPIEVTLTARPLDPSINSAYDLVTIALAGLDYRPPGTFGAITLPPDGSAVGGDQIQVAGTASGLPDNQLTLTLLAADGTVIDSQTIIIDNPYRINDLPWRAEISTNGYMGAASLQVSGQQVIAEINLTIDTTAG